MTRSVSLRLMRGAAWMFASAVVVSACGGDGETFSAAESPPTTVAGGTQAPSDEDAVRPQLICEDPPPTEVGLGLITESNVDLEATFQCFWVEVPDGLDSVTFELDGMTGDLEAYVGYGFLVRLQYPGLGEHWSAPAAGTDVETIVIDDPKPGPYFVYVRIAEPNVETSFSLAVSATPETTTPASGATLPDPNTCAPPATVVQLDTSVAGEIVGKDSLPLEHVYYCVDVPAGVNSITVEVTGLTDAVEVLARYSNEAQIFSDRRRTGPDRVVVIETTNPGAYFIDVAAALAGAASQYTLSVTGQ